IGLRLTIIPAIPRARYSIRESSPYLDFGNLLFLFIARNCAAFVRTWSGNGVNPVRLTIASCDQHPQAFRTSAYVVARHKSLQIFLPAASSFGLGDFKSCSSQSIS